MERRTRNWATVLYPESAPEDWREILADQHIPALVSPLHNRDLDADGEQKKPHYHVMLLFDGMKTQAQAIEVFKKIGGVGAEMVASVRGYARYLIHADSPCKAQYDANEVSSFSGANYLDLISMPADKYTAIAEMIDYAEEKGILSFAELVLYARNNRKDWFRILCDSGSAMLIQYMKSRYWQINKKD